MDEIEQLKLKKNRSAFPIAAPTWWNTLHPAICQTPTLLAFQKTIKI